MSPPEFDELCLKVLGHRLPAGKKLTPSELKLLGFTEAAAGHKGGHYTTNTNSRFRRGREDDE